MRCSDFLRLVSLLRFLEILLSGSYSSMALAVVLTPSSPLLPFLICSISLPCPPLSTPTFSHPIPPRIHTPRSPHSSRNCISPTSNRATHTRRWMWRSTRNANCRRSCLRRSVGSHRDYFSDYFSIINPSEYNSGKHP